jgi:acyl carrier protein
MEKFKFQVTNRGFGCITFKDKYGADCSLQKSSRIPDGPMDECIWLGAGKDRMHLTQEHVQMLIPLLQNFVKTGQLEPSIKKAPTSKKNKSHVCCKNCGSDECSCDGSNAAPEDEKTVGKLMSDLIDGITNVNCNCEICQHQAKQMAEESLVPKKPLTCKCGKRLVKGLDQCEDCLLPLKKVKSLSFDDIKKKILGSNKDYIYNKIIDYLISDLDVKIVIVKPTTTYTELNLDTLDIFDLSMMIEQEFGVDMDNFDMSGYKSLDDTIVYIIKQQKLTESFSKGVVAGRYDRLHNVSNVYQKDDRKAADSDYHAWYIDGYVQGYNNLF